MHDVVSLVFEIYYAAFCGWCLQYFYGSFLEYKSQERRWNGFCVTVSYTALRLCVNRLQPSDYGDIRTMDNLILHFTIIAVLALCFYRAVKAITGYLIITFMAVTQISFFIAHSIFWWATKLNNLWGWCVENGYIAGEKMLRITMHTTIIIPLILFSGVFSVLCYPSLKKITQSFREKEYAVQRTELVFILAPSMAGLLICVLLRIIVLTIENGMPELIYEKYPMLILVVPAILILCLLTIIYGVKLFQDMIYLNRERNSRAILEKQVSSMQEQIAEMEHIHSGIRSMKHDMKNTLTVIMQLADKNGNAENTELHAYLSALNQTFDRLEFRFQTGNTVVDTLLGMKYHDIMRTIPDLRLNADKLLFPENLIIQSYDIGVILGNALDNAKKCADQNLGYKVFDADGKVVYEPKVAETAVKVPFLVKVSIFDLNIRKGPGTGYKRVQFCPPGIYTIVAVSDGAGASLWGKLKSGIGWLSLDYCKRV